MAGGPALPIEFSRVSGDGRLTAVIDRAHGEVCVTRFAISPQRTVTAAAEDLRRRESSNIASIGFYDTKSSQSSTQLYTEQPQIVDAVRTWCAANNVDSLIWTALGSNFDDKARGPFSVDAAIKYLQGLNHDARGLALRYIRRAPPETATPLRRKVQEYWPG